MLRRTGLSLSTCSEVTGLILVTRAPATLTPAQTFQPGLDVFLSLVTLTPSSAWDLLPSRINCGGQILVRNPRIGPTVLTCSWYLLNTMAQDVLVLCLT